MWVPSDSPEMTTDESSLYLLIAGATSPPPCPCCPLAPLHQAPALLQWATMETQTLITSIITKHCTIGNCLPLLPRSQDKTCRHTHMHLMPSSLSLSLSLSGLRLRWSGVWVSFYSLLYCNTKTGSLPFAFYLFTLSTHLTCMPRLLVSKSPLLSHEGRCVLSSLSRPPGSSSGYLSIWMENGNGKKKKKVPQFTRLPRFAPVWHCLAVLND